MLLQVEEGMREVPAGPRSLGILARLPDEVLHSIFSKLEPSVRKAMHRTSAYLRIAMLQQHLLQTGYFGAMLGAVRKLALLPQQQHQQQAPAAQPAAPALHAPPALQAGAAGIIQQVAAAAQEAAAQEQLYMEMLQQLQQFQQINVQGAVVAEAPAAPPPEVAGAAGGAAAAAVAAAGMNAVGNQGLMVQDVQGDMHDFLGGYLMQPAQAQAVAQAANLHPLLPHPMNQQQQQQQLPEPQAELSVSGEISEGRRHWSLYCLPENQGQQAFVEQKLLQSMRQQQQEQQRQQQRERKLQLVAAGVPEGLPMHEFAALFGPYHTHTEIMVNLRFQLLAANQSNAEAIQQRMLHAGLLEYLEMISPYKAHLAIELRYKDQPLSRSSSKSFLVQRLSGRQHPALVLCGTSSGSSSSAVDDAAVGQLRQQAEEERPRLAAVMQAAAAH